MSTPTNPPSQKDVQQLFYVFQVLEDQQKGLIEQLKMLEGQIRGVTLSKITLEGFSEITPDQEVLLPVGANAYTKAKLIDPSKVTVSISSDMLIEKNLEDGLNSISKLLENYSSIKERLNGQLGDVEGKLAQIRPQIENLYRMSGIAPK
ncbi:prefoldin subunit alpha [Candidatus Lokiarchaeum ossiferum]|uniref:prefoldin subunit alpha n=1 Tax=Candidatus Lokiarchaeum ossiferum TaxID=2951803 RepID=UPI00352DE231